MKKNIFFLLILIVPIISMAQDDEKKIKPELYGFIKNDMFWDSRQTVAVREGHFLLFPKEVDKDDDGIDRNGAPSFNFLALQSRLGVKIEGAEAFGAKISGKIEGDFFAQANDNINLFRLRHAYLKLNWSSTEILFGQYWIPMFVTGCFPGTISFNTGVPFQPFGRNPQVRLTQKLGPLKIIAIANSQRDYSSRGASGVTGTYLRNSSMPEFSGQLHFNLKNEAGDKEFLIGAGGSYKTIVPQIETAMGFATDESVSGFNAIAFMKLELPVVTVKMEGVYGQNMPDVLSLGGIGVTSLDTIKGVQTYATLNTMSAWADISTNIKKVEIGVFTGLSLNLGANEDIIGSVYGLGTNIATLYRISPRIAVKCNKVKFALEGEYTIATYGATLDARAIPTDVTGVNNLRILFAAYYFF